MVERTEEYRKQYKENKISYNKGYDSYKENHKCCPKCNSKAIGQSYVCYDIYCGQAEFPKDFVDGNYCFCQCGWSGIIHNLVAESFDFVPNQYPEKIGFIPRDDLSIRTEIEVIPADEPKQLKLGWIVREKVGDLICKRSK